MPNNAMSTSFWMILSDLFPHGVLLMRWEVGSQHRPSWSSIQPGCGCDELFGQNVCTSRNSSSSTKSLSASMYRFNLRNPLRKEMDIRRNSTWSSDTTLTQWAKEIGNISKLESVWLFEQVSMNFHLPRGPDPESPLPCRKITAVGVDAEDAVDANLVTKTHATFGYGPCAKSIHSGLYRSLTLNRNAPWMNCKHLQTTRSSQATAGLGRLLPISTSEKSLRHPRRRWEVDFASFGAAQQDVSKMTQPFSPRVTGFDPYVTDLQKVGCDKKKRWKHDSTGFWVHKQAVTSLHIVPGCPAYYLLASWSDTVASLQAISMSTPFQRVHCVSRMFRSACPLVPPANSSAETILQAFSTFERLSFLSRFSPVRRWTPTKGRLVHSYEPWCLNCTNHPQLSMGKSEQTL